MKLIKNVAFLAFVIAFLFSCEVSEDSNLYALNKQIPTDSALVFGKGIVSTNAFEFAITLSPEMDEIFFTRREPEKSNEIYTMRFIDGKWSSPQSAFFKAEEGWDFEPHIDPTGKRLYFGSIRPLIDSTKSTGLYQWYCEKSDNGWSDPVPLGKPFIDKSVIMYLTSASNGNLYFTTGEKGDKPEDWAIYYSKYENERYENITRMGEVVNFSGKYIAHPYIAPDESYIIYDGKSDAGFGGSDLYISFNRNGLWTKAVNMGQKVNTDQTEMCASVSPDGKFLFFHRGGDTTGNLYWINFVSLKKHMEVMSRK